jgi:transposase-like protein
MSKKYQKQSASSSKRERNRQRRANRNAARRELRERLEQFPSTHEEFLSLAQESWHSFALDLGVLFAGRLLENEVTVLCGPRYERNSQRNATRYGHQPGVVSLAGQKVSLRRPRVRSVSAQGTPREVELPLYRAMQRPESMPQACLKRMVRRVSCRDYEGVVDLAQEGFGVQRSSVSRGFVRASADAVRALAERRWEGVRFVAAFIDGIEYAGETLVVALGLDALGHKHVLGVREGATENTPVVTALLEELVERGLDTTQPLLFVLDGAQALAAAVKRVCGRQILIQRCQVHKQRNVKAHLAETHHAELERRLHHAYQQTDYAQAVSLLQDTGHWLQRINPAAANSLREGLEETVTVVRLKLPETLRRTLATTNPIESALSVVRDLTARVKRWRDGDMRLRWCAAGLLRAEEKFRRIRGYSALPVLVAALDAAHLDAKPKAG